MATIGKTTVSEPRVDIKPEVTYVGIRTQTQFKGMFQVADKLFKELNAWMKKQGLELAGPPFLRFHVIDMAGEMDIEVGIPVAGTQPGDERVKPGTVPAGRYASLIFRGNGYVGNSTLIRWAEANGLKWDRWDDPKGDGFRSRYEAYLTDPKIEPRKSKWDVEVAIKLAGD